MTMFIDAGGWSWTRAYGDQGDLWRRELDQRFANSTCFICFDSPRNIRREHIPWYKANRINEPPQTVELREKARVLRAKVKDEYPEYCIEEDGLEADDIIAERVRDGDWIIGAEKDYLQLPVRCHLFRATGDPVTTKKFDLARIDIKRGAMALGYQLLYGDLADGVHRSYYGKREVAQMALQTGLSEVIKLIPYQELLDRVRALMLPTPLMYPDRNPVRVMLERYK